MHESAWWAALERCVKAFSRERCADGAGLRSVAWKVAIACPLKETLLCRNGWLAERLGMGTEYAVSRYVSELRRGERKEAEDLLVFLGQGCRINPVSRFPVSCFLGPTCSPEAKWPSHRAQQLDGPNAKNPQPHGCGLLLLLGEMVFSVSARAASKAIRVAHIRSPCKSGVKRTRFSSNPLESASQSPKPFK